MKNALIWFAVMSAILVIVGKLPKSATEWRIVMLGAFLFWCATGVMLFVRFAYRFIVR